MYDFDTDALRRMILGWLKADDSGRLEDLWRAADATRLKFVGEAVHLRALVEISNCCARQCAYCGLRAGNTGLERYRMSAEEILSCAMEADSLGIGTIVLQSAEDYGLSAEWIASVIRRIKSETPMAVTLSLGERSDADLEAWREAGADRYFLRFETSDADLYKKIHPLLPERPVNRIEMLQKLQALGYQTGSGVMIGIPGQSFESLADDILLFRRLDLDMVGVGPWLPHPATPLGSGEMKMDIRPRLLNEGRKDFNARQVPNSEIMTYKVIALTRLVRPDANIPATTALATLNADWGYELGLTRGANVIMPNFTPCDYRKKYEIYPKKILFPNSLSNFDSIHSRIEAIGRTVGKGRGDRMRLNLCNSVSAARHVPADAANCFRILGGTA